jgi:L-seryl-tRNA(Ser) seleniumtransferase
MAPEVVDAMVEASKECIKIDELQAAASRIIAELTGAEAGYVTCGAASGLTLGTAACIAGLDVRRIERMPDTTDMPNEVIMAKDHRCGYDHAIRAAGAKIVEVGLCDYLNGSMRPVETWEFECAINERTSAIALVLYVSDPDKERQLQEVAEMAHTHHIPVLVDAAASVPPLENFKKFIALGADLVVYSGGKAIRGPQNTGIICGGRDLIASVALQHLDLGGFTHMWFPPPSLIPKEKLLGQPHQGIGRCQKVAKESLVGLLARLRTLTTEKTVDEAEHMQEKLARIMNGIEGISHVHSEIVHPASDGNGAVPTLKIRLDSSGLGKDAFQVSLDLREGDPRIWVNEKNLPNNILTITAVSLPDEQVDRVARRLREVFSA